MGRRILTGMPLWERGRDRGDGAAGHLPGCDEEGFGVKINKEQANALARKIVGDHVVLVAGAPSMSAYEAFKGDKLVAAIEQALLRKKAPSYCVRCGHEKPCPEHFKGM